MMTKSLTNDHWKSTITILEILLEVLNTFKKPDESQEFFKGNTYNEAAFDLYTKGGNEHGAYYTRARYGSDRNTMEKVYYSQIVSLEDKAKML